MLTRHPIPGHSLPAPARPTALVLLALMLLALVFQPRVVGAQAQSSSEVSGPWVAPERASHRSNPLPADPKVVKRGRDMFERDCAKCHGKLGRGDGLQAPHLEVKPQDLTADAVTSQSDGALFWKITEGRGPMPKAKLSDEEKWMVIDYLRTLAHRQ